MKLDSLEDVYVSELKDLYSAENQLLKALPQMAKATSTDELREAFEAHLEETRTHVQRLDDLFEKIGVSPKGKKCKAMEGLIAEAKELLEEAEDADPAALDAALIASAQRVEHYEIAGYGCVRTYARLLGDEEAANLLQETLDEEGAADKKLTEIAEGIVNEEAADGETEESESDEGDDEETKMSDARQRKQKA